MSFSDVSRLHVSGWARKGGLYTCTLHVVKGGSRVSAAGDRPRGVVTIGGDELNDLWSVRRCAQGRRGEERAA